MNRDPHEVHFLKNDPERLDRALEHRSERHIENESFLCEKPGGLRGLFPSFIGEPTSVHPVKRFSLFQVLSP